MDTNKRWVVRSADDFGRAMSELRRHRGLTQAELADRVGLSRSYLARIEGGRSASLLEHILRTLRRLGATVTVTLAEGPRDGDGDGDGDG